LLQQLDALPAQMATRLQDRLDAILQPLALPPLLQQSRDAAAGLLQRLDRIEAALLELADTRIKAAIGLDYERLATGAALLDVDLDLRSPEFSGRHADLLALRLDRVLVDSTRDGAGVALRLFLHQQRLRRRFSLGLALGSELVDMARSGNEWVLVDRRALDEDGQQ